MVENIEKLQKRVLGIRDVLETPASALTYSVAQFMNLLRERGFAIPVSTTEEITKTIYHVATDPSMYFKLLNEGWVKNILASFIAKDVDERKRFDIHFKEALEMGGAKREIVEKRQYHNIAMKYFGDLIPRFVEASGFKNPYVSKEDREKVVNVKHVVSDLVSYLDQMGYKTARNPSIMGKIPKESRHKKLNSNLLELIKDQMRKEIVSFEKNVHMDDWDSKKLAKRKREANFSGEYFDEGWMRKVLRKVYDKDNSPHFDAALDGFLMSQRQKTLESEVDESTVKEEEGLNPNVLLGALNDYLVEIHGSAVPRIYDFPLKSAKVTETINKDAAIDAAALVLGERSFENIRRVTIVNKYGNLIERTLYLRALKKHMQSALSTIVNVAVNMDDYELEMLSKAYKKIKDRFAESMFEEDTSDMDDFDDEEFSDLYGVFGDPMMSRDEILGARSGVIEGTTTDKELMVANLGQFIEFAIKRKSYQWTFREGEKKGQKVKIETIDDYLQYRKERREEKENSRERIDISSRASFASTVEEKDPFLSRKDIRDLKRLIGDIDDENIKTLLKDLIGKNTGKYSRDIVDKILNALDGSKQSDTFKKELIEKIKEFDLTIDEVKKIREVMDNLGEADLRKKFDRLIQKNMSFTVKEMGEIHDMVKELKNRKEMNSFNELFDDSILPFGTINKVMKEVKKIGSKTLERNLSRFLDENRFSKKELDTLIELIDRSGDQNVKKQASSALKSMKFLKSKGFELKKLVEGNKQAGSRIQSIIGDKNELSIDDVRKLNDLVEKLGDKDLEKKVNKILDSMDFATSGMNDLLESVNGMDSGKVKNAIARILGKKISASDIKKIDEVTSRFSGIESFSKVDTLLRELSFSSRDVEEIEQAIKNIENKYDLKAMLGETLSRKKIRISGKDADLLESLIRQMRRDKGEVGDIVDMSRFTREKSRRLLDFLGNMDNEESLRDKLERLFLDIDGRGVSPDIASKARKKVTSLDDVLKERLEDILDRANENGRLRKRDNTIKMLEDTLDEMEVSFQKHGNQLKIKDKGAWEYTKDTIDFWKKRLQAMKKGREDPSSLFENMENGTNLNMVIRRLANTEDAEQLALDWMGAMHKMFNEFASSVSDEEQKALFHNTASRLKIGEEKLRNFTKEIELDEELKKQYEEGNKIKRELKERFNDKTMNVRKWFEEQGLSMTEALKERASFRVRNDQGGNQLFPPSGATRLDFGNHQPRNFTTILSNKKRRFLSPSLEDVKFFSEVGDEKTPWTFVNFLGDEAGDEIISRLEQFGNLGREKAIEKLKEERTGKGEEIGLDQDDPDSAYFQKIVDNMLDLEEEDIERDFARKFGQMMAQQLSPEIMWKMFNEQPPPNPKDQLDVEGDIDMPHQPLPVEEAGSRGLTIEQKDPAFPSRCQAGRGRGESFTGVLSGCDPEMIEEEAPEYEGIEDLGMEALTKSVLVDFLEGKKQLDGAEYDGTGTIDPEEWFKEGKILNVKNIEELLKQMVDKPYNASIMRKRFRSFYRNFVSQIRKMREGKIKSRRVDKARLVREVPRHGKNPRNDKPVITGLPRKRMKNVKRDVIAVDVSGSMYSYLGVASQLIATFADPKYLRVVAFDNDAIQIDQSIFKKNPAVIFKDMDSVREFVTAAASKQDRKWEGTGSTSYDSASTEINKLNVNKGDRLLLLGDLEHNTVLDKNKAMFNEWIKNGECKNDGDRYYDCTAVYFSKLCKKADSCIAINPKVNVGDDITCELLDHGIPTCFTGALSGSKGKAEEGDNHVLGEGLRRTVECLKMGMTGEKPRANKKVKDYCKAKSEGLPVTTVKPF